MMHARTAVAVTGFNRPYYFLPSLRSILNNEEIVHCDLWIFLDGGDRNAQDLQVRMAEYEVEQSIHQPAEFNVILRSTNFGCGRNLIDVRRRLFDVEGYHRVFVFEDDMLVASNYLRVCGSVSQWADANYRDVGVVQAYNACWLSVQEKSCKLDEVRATNSHWWGYLMPRQTWLSIRNLLFEYEQIFLLDRHYSKRDSPRIRSWFRALIAQSDSQRLGEPNLGISPDDAQCFPGAWDYRSYFQGNCPCGQDAATALALALAGYKKIATTVNRGLPIGRHGIHSTDSSFKRHRLDKIQLDVFESDRYFRRFEPHQQGLLSLAAFMRADEIEALRSLMRERQPSSVLEIGCGGSTVTLSREPSIECWWGIESNDVWLRKLFSAMSSADAKRITVLSFCTEHDMSRFESLLHEKCFDMYFVDGGNRPELLKRLHAHLRNRPGFVVLHDYSRPEYREAIRRFSKTKILTLPIGDHQGLMVLEP